MDDQPMNYDWGHQDAAGFDVWFERVGLYAQYVYIMYNEHGDVLYVGITNNIRNRLSAHYSEKPWIQEVSNVAVETYKTREEAKSRESELIDSIGPVYNLAENQRLTNVVTYFTRKIAENCPDAGVEQHIDQVLTRFATARAMAKQYKGGRE